MGKDFKEKYERVCMIKDRAINLVETQLNANIENVDAKELGEVADIAKDMAELMKYCAEAEYYHKVTEAMDESSKEEKSHYMNKYIPEYEGKFYTEPKDWLGDDRHTVYNPMDDRYRFKPTKMYYSDMNNNRTEDMMNGGMDSGRDSREGRSGITRKTYMDMKDAGSTKEQKVNEIKKWASDLSEDVFEMLEGASPEEKAIMKQHFVSIAQKINS